MFGRRGSFYSLVLRFLMPLRFGIEGDGAGGGGDDDWTDSIPETVREWDEVKNSDSPEKFWDQMMNMRSRMGASIRIPGSDAGEDDLNSFHQRLQEKVPGLMKSPDIQNHDDMVALYNRLGRPEAPDAYTMPEIKDVNGDIIDPKTLDNSLTEVFRPIAHYLGLSQDQFKGIVEGITQHNMSSHAQLVDKQRQEQDALSTEWGAAFDRNNEIVNNFLQKAGAPENVLAAVNGGYADKNTMKWFHQLATQTLGQKADFINDDNSQNAVMTPGEAALKISEIRNNKDHPYNKKNDPGHRAAMEYMRSLYLYKNPKSGKENAPGTMFEVGGVQ